MTWNRTIMMMAQRRDDAPKGAAIGRVVTRRRPTPKKRSVVFSGRPTLEWATRDIAQAETTFLKAVDSGRLVTTDAFDQLAAAAATLRKLGADTKRFDVLFRVGKRSPRDSRWFGQAMAEAKRLADEGARRDGRAPIYGEAPPSPRLVREAFIRCGMASS